MSDKLKLIVGSDSAGFEYKNAILADLRNDPRVESVEDLGVHAEDLAACSYGEVAIHAAEKIRSGEASRSVLVCGTGIGMAIAANKVAVERLPGVDAGSAGDRTRAGSPTGVRVAGLHLRSELAIEREGRRDHGVRAPPKRVNAGGNVPIRVDSAISLDGAGAIETSATTTPAINGNSLAPSTPHKSLI